MSARALQQLVLAREAVLNLERAIETLRSFEVAPSAIEPYLKALEVNRAVVARWEARTDQPVGARGVGKGYVSPEAYYAESLLRKREAARG